MSGEPDNANPYARRMKEVFDFDSHPGIALVRPEIAKQLIAACKPPAPCAADAISTRAQSMPGEEVA